MNFWHNRSVWVTGATGFLGRHLVAELERLGAVCFKERYDWRTIDVEYIVSVFRAGNWHDFTIIHLAAQTNVQESITNPTETLLTNIRGTWTLLEACRQFGNIGRIIVASSDKAYGESTVLPCTEQTPLRGLQPYPVSKSCVDLIAQMYAHTYKLPIAITRCGNLFGPDDDNPARLVPSILAAVRRDRAPTLRSNGQSTRDYFYIEDAVHAYLTLAEMMGPRLRPGHAFNFSYGQPITTLDMTKKVLAAMGRSDLMPIIQNAAPDEIQHQYLDCTKAKKLLAWQPRYGLEEGLRRTVAAFQAREKTTVYDIEYP